MSENQGPVDVGAQPEKGGAPTVEKVAGKPGPPQGQQQAAQQPAQPAAPAEPAAQDAPAEEVVQEYVPRTDASGRELLPHEVMPKPAKNADTGEQTEN